MTTRSCCKKEYTPAEQLALLRRISAAGVWVDIEEHVPSDRGGLVIRQVGDFLGSVVDLGAYGTGCMVDVSITCDTAEFCIDDYELVLPWEDPQFRCLEATDGVLEWRAYSFPGKPPREFPRHEVINHVKPQLRRGRQIKGLLLGWGPVPIPDRYLRGRINVQLSVYDHLENRCSEMLPLCVDRSGRPTRQVLGKPSRGWLFESVEEVRAKVAAPLPADSPATVTRRRSAESNGQKGVSRTEFTVTG